MTTTKKHKATKPSAKKNKPISVGKSTVKKSAPGSFDANEVDDFFRGLKHPRKAELERVRSIILGASPAIAEGIKWNAPSFRTSEWFATMNLRASDVQIILHLGAKVRNDTEAGLGIRDPNRLLKWLANDRATVKFADLKSVKASQRALEEIVRQWIARVR